VGKTKALTPNAGLAYPLPREEIRISRPGESIIVIAAAVRQDEIKNGWDQERVTHYEKKHARDATTRLNPQ